MEARERHAGEWRRDERSRPRRDERPNLAGERRPPRREELPLPDGASIDELDADVRRELRSLPVGLAETVGGHLAAAGLLIDDDAEAAYQHAKRARELAPRLACSREAAGLAAYSSGRYAEALTELRAARRMTGEPDLLPLIADAERGVGRPERALAVAAEPDARRLPPEERMELLLVCAGARRDMGQIDAAVVALQTPELAAKAQRPWSVRHWYAYADMLVSAGRLGEARAWFADVLAIDVDGETDADERVEALDRGTDPSHPDDSDA